MAEPKNFDLKAAAELLDALQDIPAMGDRIDAASQQFLDYPYLSNPLIGSPQDPEELTISLKAFDCVTLCETALGFARAQSVDEAIAAICELRYASGKLEWLDRNHYMIDWIKNNQAKGLVENITPTEQAVTITRTLSIIEDYPAREHSIAYLPPESVPSFEEQVKSGDIIYFGTTRSNLDVFHMGLLIKKDSTVFLRHAARGSAVVFDEPLSDFMERNSMVGVLIVRPTEQE